MSENNKMITRKSIMYKMISLGCAVYLDDEDNFIVNVLVCDKCKSLWRKSRTECFYCGTPNYHVYTCTACGERYSITNAKQKCTTKDCSGELVKMCINSECISNKLPDLREYLKEKGGVFQKGKSGSCYNEMRCKACGNKSSVYLSKQVVLLDDLNGMSYDMDTIYIKKNSEIDFDVIINGETYKFDSIDKILNKAFSLKKIKESDEEKDKTEG